MSKLITNYSELLVGAITQHWLFCYFNCCCFEEWCFSKFSRKCPGRMDEIWIIYYLLWKHNLRAVLGVAERRTSPFSLWQHSHLGLMTRYLFSRRSTPSLGVRCCPFTVRRMNMTGRVGPTHAVTNYGGDGTPPDGLRRIVRVGQIPALHEMILSRAPGPTLIIIFIDECSCRQDDEVASVHSDYRMETWLSFFVTREKSGPLQLCPFGLSDLHSSYSGVTHEPAS